VLVPVLLSLRHQNLDTSDAGAESVPRPVGWFSESPLAGAVTYYAVLLGIVWASGFPSWSRSSCTGARWRRPWSGRVVPECRFT